MRKRLAARDSRGAAAVELAVVLPLLVLLVSGVIDLGRVLFTNIAIQGAAQEGAMFASFIPNDPAAVEQRVIESLDDPSLAPGDVTVSCPGVDRVEVSVTHSVDLLTPIVSGWLGGSVTLDRTVAGNVYSEAPCRGES